MQRARAQLDRSRSPDGSFEHKDLVADEAFVEAFAGNAELAERLTYRAFEAMEYDPAMLVALSPDLCRLFAIANATDAAVDCLRRVLVDPSEATPFLEPLMPEYDSIRNEPGFTALLADIEGAR